MQADRVCHVGGGDLLAAAWWLAYDENSPAV